jgi:predicted transcriptional regulator
MANLPNYRPQKLSLGPLETEILEIIWQLNSVTVKDVHDRILADPDRELAYTSVTTVLKRLTNKGWLSCDQKGRVHVWTPLVSKEEAQAINSYQQLQRFLAISNPDLVASFANDLDTASLAQLEAIAARLKAIRQQQEEEK